MPDSSDWSDRLEKMAEELDRIERQVSTDDIRVKTRFDETVVTLVYEHGDGDDSGQIDE